MKDFLCKEKQFKEGRVDSGLEKLKVAKKSGVQSSLESFFGKPTKIPPQQSSKKPAGKNKDKEPLKVTAKRK